MAALLRSDLQAKEDELVAVQEFRGVRPQMESELAELKRSIELEQLARKRDEHNLHVEMWQQREALKAAGRVEVTYVPADREGRVSAAAIGALGQRENGRLARRDGQQRVGEPAADGAQELAALRPREALAFEALLHRHACAAGHGEVVAAEGGPWRKDNG